MIDLQREGSGVGVTTPESRLQFTQTGAPEKSLDKSKSALYLMRK